MIALFHVVRTNRASAYPPVGHVSPLVVRNQLRSKKSFGSIIFIAVAVSMSSWRISRLSSQTTGASVTCG